MDFTNLIDDILVYNILVTSGIRPCGRTHSKQKNGRLNHGLLYIWNGEATFYLDSGKTFVASDGQLVYLPKGIKYKMQYTAHSTTFVVVNFSMSEQGTDFFSKKEIAVLATDDSINSIANIMAKFEVCGASQNISGSLRRKELFYRLLSLIYDNNPSIENGQYPQIVKGVMLLKQSYLENLPIEVFAKQSNVSVSTFRQLFNKQHGMSPLQYRNRLRIERAKQLLENDNCTVAEVAYASGFENIGYFCRYYKKITGETPKQTKQRNI